MPIDDRTHLTEKQNIPMRLTIATDGGAIPVPLLADVLMFLRTSYVLAWNAEGFPPAVAFEVDEHFLNLDRVEEMVKRVQERLPGPLDALVIQSWGRVALAADQDFLLLDIARENPLVLKFRGMALALATAVILGGGKFQLGPSGIKAELPGLGETVRNFRAALQPVRHEPRVPYGEWSGEMTNAANHEGERKERDQATKRADTAAEAAVKRADPNSTGRRDSTSAPARKSSRSSKKS